MKCLKFIALIISILCIFCSCSTKSGNKKLDKPVSLTTPSVIKEGVNKKVRVKRYYIGRSYNFKACNIEILTVDTMYHVGDTIIRQNGEKADWYIIQP